MMKSSMILSLYKFAFLVVLLTSDADSIASASTTESSSLRGGNGVSASRGNSELAHGFFSSSAITDTVRKLWVLCSDTEPACGIDEYYPMKCNKKGSKRAFFRNKCQARLSANNYTMSEDGGEIGFVEGDECKLINRCNYFERGRNTDPVTCNGSTWPDQCVAEKFGKCKF